MDLNTAYLVLDKVKDEIIATFPTREHRFLAGVRWGYGLCREYCEKIRQLADADGNIDVEMLKSALYEGMKQSGGEYEKVFDFQGFAAPVHSTFKTADVDRLFNEIIPSVERMAHSQIASIGQGGVK